MAVLPDPTAPMPRRKRYQRASTSDTTATLTPLKVRILRYMAECRLLSLPQIASLAELSAKGARRQMRQLFDLGLVDIVPVPRAALAETDAPNDSTLLYGSAPNIYVPSASGLRHLLEMGIIDKAMAKRAIPVYGPKNGLFLRHELMVRDVRVWLETCARHHGGEHRVLAWRDGNEAAIEMGSGSVRRVLPDAWFVYQVRAEPKSVVLVGIVEVDRGTERGLVRWQEKADAYAALFASDALLKATGYKNARVLVVTPNAVRREQLADLIAESGVTGDCIARFWIAEAAALTQERIERRGLAQCGKAGSATACADDTFVAALGLIADILGVDGKLMHRYHLYRYDYPQRIRTGKEFHGTGFDAARPRQ